ncbi:PD-(D/E)XK nuclease family protein [Candidatus Woesearchaeota archaeon]|nr:PD-(D/E)XK nuclease family protein [Candidatus Woesearchaeota archaeon]
MTCYSHSRISTFEQCRYKYKLQYIDKIKVDVPTTIECFMGDLVHRTLEKLYADLKFQKLNSKEDLLKFYNNLWDKEYTSEILIAKQDYSADNYKQMGVKFISDYYDQYKPFDQMTILGLETQDRMTLPDGNQWHVRIDKLACKDKTYYVCDYKTNSRMKDQEDADSDRQLALYSVWVKDKFPDAEKVVLLWHMLAFNKEVVSIRSDDELKKLQNDTVKAIKTIEACNDFPQNTSALCNYCVFKSICPSFKHELELEEKTVEEFKEDDGVKLVDEYAQLDIQEKDIKKKKEDIKSRLIEFSKQKEVDIVYGSNKKASIKSYDKVVYPEDKDAFLNLIKEKGIYEEVSMLCYPKLTSRINKNQIDPEIISLTSKETDYRISVSKRKNREDD